jgi:hypothetical protein
VTAVEVPPVTTAGRPSAYPDVVSWLSALRQVATEQGHRDAAAHAGRALAIIAAAHETIDRGTCADPLLMAALLGVPRP